MKAQNINLEEYCKLGGKLENLDLTKTFIIYDNNDKNKNKKIISIVSKDFKHFKVTYEDKISRTYDAYWIITYVEVEFNLSEKYTK